MGWVTCADPEGWGDRGSRPPPLKNYKNIGFLSNTGPDPLKNHKATKPAFNVVPPSARRRNAIEMAFRWRADDCPFKVVFGSSLRSSTKKSCQSWTPPPDKTIWIRAWVKKRIRDARLCKFKSTRYRSTVGFNLYTELCLLHECRAKVIKKKH